MYIIMAIHRFVKVYNDQINNTTPAYQLYYKYIYIYVHMTAIIKPKTCYSTA